MLQSGQVKNTEEGIKVTLLIRAVLIISRKIGYVINDVKTERSAA